LGAELRTSSEPAALGHRVTRFAVFIVGWDVVLEIVEVETDRQVQTVRLLFRKYFSFLRQAFAEYAQQKWFGPAFEKLEQEADALPGQYAPPNGCLLLAQYNSNSAGCVALCPGPNGACSMKRLFVRSPFRRRGIGRRLSESVIEQARSCGYARMLIHTYRLMEPAISLYRSLGFSQTAPFEEDSLDGVLFLQLELT